jgi:CelD/BcsL family acetyltransferase involved in cellulose biosynthesis
MPNLDALAPPAATARATCVLLETTPAAAPLPSSASWRVVTELAEAEALRPAWADLLERSASDDVTLTPDWLLTWWRVYGPFQGRRLRLALFFDGHRLIGLAPLLRRLHWHAPGLPFRRLELLASGEREGHGICSCHLNVIAERGAEARVAGLLGEALREEALGPWDELVLPMLAGDGPMPVLLAEALRAAGFASSVTVTGSAPCVPLPATWEGYLASLSCGRRRHLRRALRDFERWAGGEARAQRAATPADLERGKRILVGLHHRRWEGAGEAGVFRSPWYLAFHDAIMPRLLEMGALELTWLAVRGEPVAALYATAWRGKVSAYQCGRRADLPANVAPGIVLLAHALRTAIESGRRELDLLAGPYPYKLQLAPAARPLVCIRAARRSLVEGARRWAARGIGCLRAARAGASPGCRARAGRSFLAGPEIGGRVGKRIGFELISLCL